MKHGMTLVLVIVFFALAGIHFYWALGGLWGLEVTLPTTVEGVKLLSPTSLDSVIVGVGLTLFGLFYVIQGKLWTLSLPTWMINIGQWIIPFIFIIRAIGDFRYLGFFKEVKSTEFGTMDTWLYSPLCLMISVLGFMLPFSKSKFFKLKIIDKFHIQKNRE